MTISKPMKYLVICAALLASGCFDDDEEDAKAGKATYVAIGNSLTAGFQNSGLRDDWQRASYPALIAEGLGLDDFQIPLIDSPGIGSTLVDGKPGTPLRQKTLIDISPDPIAGDPFALLLNSALPRPYDNLGIPGATSSDLIKATSSANSTLPGNAYFDIVLRNGSLFQGQTLLRQAVSRRPEIVTLWIGNNDILFGILRGTVRFAPTPTVVPPDFYAANMDKALDTLLRETKAHIFLGNIPAINTIPFVTAVPPVAIDLLTRQPTTNPPTPWLTVEDSVQYVILPALADIAKGKGRAVDTANPAAGGTGEPLADTLTLTRAEAALAASLVTAYNAYLKKKADERPDRITLVDVHALMADLAAGRISGVTSNFLAFDANSAFSLDGIHPNVKGYRYVANLWIDAINGKLGRIIPKVDVNAP